jgi:phosphatidylglycerophosphatase A
MKKFILLVATGAGVGYLPGMPGTYGSIVGLAAYWGLKNLSPWPYLITLLALIFLAAWVSTIAEVVFGEKDSQKIVIDEVVGMLVALATIPFSVKAVVLGFVLFRLFDIWKPYPIRLCQERWPAGWGVVGDDLLAGIYANLLLQLIFRLPGFST